ncbi:DUF262 domain-containing protein [Stenotrophomonas muris]|uniref:DUF262 domain-containing protein n=1 Tax=Stenotrophomonas muris TaxID=2963283 RepID=UPI0039C708BE
MASDIVDEDWNEDLASEVTAKGVSSLVVYSRDWTVDTILRQIEQGNIDLNPQFQRRNAWTDAKRSKLVESLIIGVPVPEIVLAEDVSRKKSFIVIDGKQRLLALAGLSDPAKYGSWEKPILTGLQTRSDLNGDDVAALSAKADDYRQLMNADIRCTIISNYQSSDVLYDIFYRLNTGSVPLSSQELRQVLKRGPFSDFLISVTNNRLPLHEVMRLSGPDNRLRDAEIVLRYIAISLNGMQYGGSLGAFLDDSAEMINSKWGELEPVVEGLFQELNHATASLLGKFGEKVGRKVVGGKWEGRFNRALFEVQAYYFGKIPADALARVTPAEVKEQFSEFCSNTPDFLDSIETTTKNPRRYRARYELFMGFVNRVFETQIASVPVP